MRESLGYGTTAAVQAIETSGEYLDTHPRNHNERHSFPGRERLSAFFKNKRGTDEVTTIPIKETPVAASTILFPSML